MRIFWSNTHQCNVVPQTDVELIIRQRDDCAMLIRRLMRRLEGHGTPEGTSKIVEEANKYLAAHHLNGSPLRDA